ncbi:MAG: type I-E CRISPR-associated protein Cse2/CasB [Desulfobacterales bacterium]|jgi:CRISPR system Cascade subunit CasB|nr:type I-E CRISPR-associated protein Cse2/CasB [Desulfobacterales bacterium]
MSEKYLNFKKDSPEVQVLIKWWEGLEKERGERAALRRCSTLAEVVFLPSYHLLRRSLLNVGRFDDDRLSLVVGLSARVKANIDGVGIAEQMATGKAVASKDAKAKVSGLRFRRLLKVKDREELFSAMTRVIALLGGTVDLQSLARSVYLWNDRYVDIRKEWAFEYYSKAPNEK